MKFVFVVRLCDTLYTEHTQSLTTINLFRRYCYECVNKATNERKCIVCGGHRQPPVGRMVYCELCPRAYHHDCYIPPLIKVPRGKWYCHGCASKAPPPKRRGPSKKAKEKDSKDKDTKDGKESKEPKESKKEKKTNETLRENSNSNSASETNSVDQSLNNSNVPAATSKTNETTQSRYVSRLSDRNLAEI